MTDPKNAPPPATEAPAQAWPEVMTAPQLAAYLQVSQKAVYRMALAGELPAAKVAGQWRFSRRLIDRWLLALSKQAYTGPALPDEGQAEE